MDQQKFLQQLQIVLDPSKGDVRAATTTLQKEFYPNPQAALSLLELAMGDGDPAFRQLAAVEARTQLEKQWAHQTPAAQKPAIREQLLRSTLGERTPLVRKSLASVISTVARIDIDDGEWAELPGILVQAAGSPRADERAVGVYILFAILDTLGEGFAEKFVDLIQLFSRSIIDPESAEVRINTLLALGNLAIHLDSDEDEAPVRAFQAVVPAMVNVLKEAIEAQDEARTMQAFEVFQTLLTCDPRLLSPTFKDILLLMKDIAVNTNQEEDTRTQAISFLMQAVKYRKLKVQATQVGKDLTLASLQITTELDDASPEDDELTPARSALGLLDILSENLPANQVAVPLLGALGQYFTSPNSDYRRAGIMALSMCVEGTPDFISTQIHEIFPVILQLLADGEARVRMASLHCVTRLAEAVSEDVNARVKEVMPLLLRNLSDAMEKFDGQEKGPLVDFTVAAVAAIDGTVECMDERDVVPYLGELVPVLQKLFKHPNYKVKGLTAGALGTIATSSGEAFLPYFDESMHLMQDYAALTGGEAELELRANVTDAMGDMSTSAGPEHFKNYVKPLMHATEEALQLDHSRLKETTYMFWASMSRVYGEEFTPFLDGIVKGLFECLDQEEVESDAQIATAAKELIGQEVTVGGQKLRVVEPEKGDGDLDDDDDDDDDVDWEDLAASPVTPGAQEKEVAVDVIGDMISHVKKAYIPYFERTIEKILPLAEHPYEGVRKSVIGTLHRAYATLWQICEENGSVPRWEPGQPMSQPPAEVKKLAEIVMTATVKMWTDEDDMPTVSDINRNLAENLRTTGPFLLSSGNTLEHAIGVLTAIIKKEHPCQFEGDEDDVDEAAAAEGSELDWVVIDTALDVVSGMAVALGPDFLRVWPEFEKPVLRFASGSENIERATAVGVLAEVVTGLDDACTPLVEPTLLPMLTRRLGDPDPQTKSNAAYAIGRVVEKAGPDADAAIASIYPPVLEKLDACLDMHVARLPDNSAGCLARMISKHRELVPLPDAVPALLRVLPLRADYQENEPVYRCICQLYKWEDQTMQSLTPQLLPVLHEVLKGDPEQVEPEVRSELVGLVNFIDSMQPGAVPWASEL